MDNDTILKGLSGIKASADKAVVWGTKAVKMAGNVIGVAAKEAKYKLRKKAEEIGRMIP